MNFIYNTMKHLLYFKESLYTNFKEGDIVVAINNAYKLIVGHRYEVYKINDTWLWVKDVVNNETIFAYVDDFLSEAEYEMRDDIKKYNL